MKKSFLKKKDNKGFSLVELLVALAVSSVVMTIIIAFISQGTRFYNKQGGSINLQNELQEASNVIDEAIQEATYLEIQTGTDRLSIYTGEYDSENFLSSKGSSRLIYRDGTNLYSFDKPSASAYNDTLKPGYRYSTHIKNITVKINDNCKSGDSTITQPVMLDVTITLLNNNIERSETKTITVRNTLDTLKIGADEYTKQSNSTRLNKA